MVGLVLSRINLDAKVLIRKRFQRGEMFHGYAEICQVTFL